MIKSVFWSSCLVFLYSCQTLKNLDFPRYIFEKYSNIKFHENHPVGAALFHSDGQEDRYDKANSRFSQFLESA